MIHGAYFSIHKQNGKLRNGNLHHHLETKKFLVDRVKRKVFVGSFFDCQGIVHNEFALEINL
jgi:hypothetical protein